MDELLMVSEEIGIPIRDENGMFYNFFDVLFHCIAYEDKYGRTDELERFYQAMASDDRVKL